MHRYQHPNGSNGSSAYVSAIRVPFNKAVLRQIRLYRLLNEVFLFPFPQPSRQKSQLYIVVAEIVGVVLITSSIFQIWCHSTFSNPFFKSSENTFYVHHICSLTCLYLDFVSFLDAKFSVLQLFGFVYHHYSCVSLFLCFVFCLFYLFYLGYLCWGRELYYLKRFFFFFPFSQL